MRDEGFIRAIQDNPKDDTSLLVYADWLDEQADAVSTAKAEFLRVTVEVATSTKSKGWKKERRKRLQELAAKLDTDWLAVMSRLRIENCQHKGEDEGGRVSYLLQFDVVCDRRWEELSATEDRSVRVCDACERNVHYCDTIIEARRHAQQRHCIAVDLGVIRRKDDLEPQRMWLGRPSAEDIRYEEERMIPDAVSAERERRKRSKETEASE